MEFTGSIQFADESSWLTLTTESDDTVTITVKFGSRIISSKEVLSFDVTPNSGIVRLPAGEILRALIGNGIGMATGSFTAIQGSSSCSYSFSVLPCRKFAYKSLSTTIFTTRPTKSPAYEGEKDRIYFYRTSGDVSTYVRFKYRAGGTSSSYTLTPTYYLSSQYYDLDISVDTMLSTAASKGLDTSKITGFEIWIEYSGSKSETYSFEIRRPRLSLKTYKFLGRRGTYEYIHATGKFSRSIESETQVFVTSGIEKELANDYSKTYEQNSGHIDSIGMNGYWLEFLAAKERYIIEKDGSERAIVVDEFKTSLTDRAVSSLTFKWHYANPSNTTIDMTDIPLTGLTISGASSVNNDSNTAQFSVGYTPSNTTQRGVTWSIESGLVYASINQNGLLTVKSGANASSITIKATSTVNSSISATKSIAVIYNAAVVALTGLSISGDSTVNNENNTAQFSVGYTPSNTTQKGVTWSITSGSDYASIDQNGLLTVKSGASSSVVAIRATSMYNTAIYAEKTVSVTYTQRPSIEFDDGDVWNVEASATYTYGQMTVENLIHLEASVSGSLENASAFVDEQNYVNVSFAANTSTTERHGTVTVTGTRTDGNGTYSKSFTIVQASILLDGYTGIAGAGNGLGSSNGYIDTDFILESGDKVTLRMTRGGSMTDSCAFWGWRWSGNYLGSSQCYTNYNADSDKFALTIGGRVRFGNVDYAIGVHELVIDFGQISATLDGAQVSAASGSSFVFSYPFDSNGSAVYPAHLLAFNNMGTADSIAPNWFINGYTVERGGIKEVDMIPAKRNSDGVVGMYDTVRERFFTSANSAPLTEQEDDSYGDTETEN